MTKTGWQTCSDPQAMLAFLGSAATERKRDLLRRTWHLQIVDYAGPFGAPAEIDDEYQQQTQDWIRECHSDECNRIRCMFNPFSSAGVDYAGDSTIVRPLAEAAYENLNFATGELEWDRLAVLSDALEEFDFHPDLSSHLRDSASHWRGCWAVDLILGLS